MLPLEISINRYHVVGKTSQYRFSETCGDVQDRKIRTCVFIGTRIAAVPAADSFTERRKNAAVS